MSAKGFWLSQDGHVAPLIVPVSAGAAVTATRFSMADYAHASILLGFGAAGGPIGAITLKAFAAETGGSGTAIAYRLFKQEASSGPYDVLANNSSTGDGNFPQAATGYTPSADAANAFYIIEVDAADLLAAGVGPYLELDIAVGSLGSTAQLLAAYAVLSGGRFTGDQSATVQA
jgi:hypothetical protein